MANRLLSLSLYEIWVFSGKEDDWISPTFDGAWFGHFFIFGSDAHDSKQA
jgi:hypothetical protein